MIDTVPASFADLDRDATADLLAAFFDDPSRFDDPFALFARLRTLEPVHWSRTGTWVVTGHPEARALLQGGSLGRAASARAQFEPLVDRARDDPASVHAVDILLASVINRDPPDHTRLRSLMARTFTPRAVDAWRPRIVECVDALVDEVAGRDRFDFLHDLAYALPQTIICELLEVPPEALGTSAPGLASSKVMTVRGADDVVPPTPEDLRAATVASLVAQADYFRGVIEDRLRRPGDDLISRLALAADDGDRLSMDELIGSVTILIGAGHETTANLVANGMLALLRHRDVYRRFLADPTTTLGPVMEEIVRFASPSPGQPRVALERIDIAGVAVEPGDQVFVILNAANRDPRVFADPERFDIDRANNRDHLTFTLGAHHCLGASLARLEAATLFDAVARRLGPLHLDTDRIRWRPTYVRSMVTLPVRQDRR